jgi:hypothetical protein
MKSGKHFMMEKVQGLTEEFVSKCFKQSTVKELVIKSGQLFK